MQSQKRYCTECGNVINTEGKFCHYCGREINKDASRDDRALDYEDISFEGLDGNQTEVKAKRKNKEHNKRKFYVIGSILAALFYAIARTPEGADPGHGIGMFAGPFMAGLVIAAIVYMTAKIFNRKKKASLDERNSFKDMFWFTSFVVAILLLIVGLVNPQSSSARQQMIDGCMSSGDVNMQYCECMADDILSGHSEKDLEVMMEDWEEADLDPRAAPQPIASAVQRCFQHI